MENQQTKNRGGKRAGAGRKPIGDARKKVVTITIDSDLMELWDSLEYKSKTVCDFLRKEFADKIK